MKAKPRKRRARKQERRFVGVWPSPETEFPDDDTVTSLLDLPGTQTDNIKDTFE